MLRLSVCAGFVVVATLLPAGCGEAAAATPAATALPFALDPVRETFEGDAREVLQVEGYTYVAVEVGPDDVRWTASLAKPLAPGARVRVRSFGSRRDFLSHQLSRTFPELRFGVVSVVDPA